MHLAADVYKFITNVIAASMLPFTCRVIYCLKDVICIRKSVKNFSFKFPFQRKRVNLFCAEK